MKYVVGIDYGTLSGRAVLIDAESGAEVASSVLEYPHAVMDTQLPSGERLPADFALQHPADYLEVLRVTIPSLLRDAGITADEVRGVGIDFTGCTMLPIDKNGTPLCMTEKYKDEKHAYVKLWKHHAAAPYADRLNALAKERGEKWLSIYGGTVSCEWALPKILETLCEAPEVYADTDRFIEAADYLSLVLTGEETHSAIFAGFKWLWNERTGYPSNDFMEALDPRLSGIVGTKISERVVGTDGIAGRINESGAALTGLAVGTPVAIPLIDAHAGMPTLNATGEGDLILIIGTSACQLVNDRRALPIDGICGYVKDGTVPGLYTYEAGQAAVGDIFDWFVKNGVPASYHAAAAKEGVSIHQYLRARAERLAVGESGLLALDWHNGNRSTLVNPALSGMVLGLTLATRPEEIYRALIEGTAFGLRVIVEQYEKGGIEIRHACAAGGIANKDPMLMQIYADVLNKSIAVAGSSQAGALGSAAYAAVAAGIYPDIRVASEKLAPPYACVYTPKPENVAAYEALYREYKTLYDYFGKKNAVMERLRK